MKSASNLFDLVNKHSCNSLNRVSRVATLHNSSNYTTPSGVFDAYNLNIFHQNERGLRTKYTQLRSSYPLFCSYDIVILTETWLSSDFNKADLGLTNICIFGLDRHHNNSNLSRGGGVLLTVKTSLKIPPVFSIVSNVK